MPHANDQAHLQATETSSRPSKSTHKHSLLHCLVCTVCNKHQGTHTPRHQHKARKAQLDVCCWQHCTKTNPKTKIIQAIFGLSSEPHAHHARCQKRQGREAQTSQHCLKVFHLRDGGGGCRSGPLTSATQRRPRDGISEGFSTEGTNTRCT